MAIAKIASNNIIYMGERFFLLFSTRRLSVPITGVLSREAPHDLHDGSSFSDTAPQSGHILIFPEILTPQWGHTSAEVDTSLLHSGHLIIAITKLFCACGRTNDGSNSQIR